VIGGVAARFIGKDHAQSLQAQLDKGGLLLWVRTADATLEQKALEILREHGGEDVHVHDLPASEQPDDNPLGGIQIDPALPGAKI
jgi:hypothetical protein